MVLLSLSSRFLVTVLGIVAFLFSGLVMRWVDVLFFSACFRFFVRIGAIRRTMEQLRRSCGV